MKQVIFWVKGMLLSSTSNKKTAEILCKFPVSVLNRQSRGNFFYQNQYKVYDLSFFCGFHNVTTGFNNREVQRGNTVFTSCQSKPKGKAQPGAIPFI